MEWLRGLGGRTAVMGVLNVTPDSFSDGGLYAGIEAASARAKEMVAEGADLLDVGGESTRPGAEDVSVDEELRRVVPVIERIAALGVPVSVDTRKAAVAAAAIDAGAAIVNDVSAGTYDREMLPLVAERGVDVVLMHMRGTPKTMDAEAEYTDVVTEVRRELVERVSAAQAAGVATERILVDPGLGFAKGAEESLEVVRRIDELAGIGRPLVVGPSRKRFVGHILDSPIDDRLEGTAAVVAWLASRGTDVVRVHDVGVMRRVVETIAAIRGAGDGA